MKDNDLKEVIKIIVCLGMSLFLGLALVYISEKYSGFVPFSYFVSLLFIVGIILIKLDKKNTDL